MATRGYLDVAGFSVVVYAALEFTDLAFRDDPSLGAVSKREIDTGGHFVPVIVGRDDG